MAAIAADPLVCKLCNVSLLNEQTKESHMLGKRHQLALHSEHMAQLKESCGVFITGFPNLVPQDELLSLFSEYGTVSDHHFGDRNRFLILQFDSPEPVKVLLTKNILVKGKKLSIRQRVIRGRDGGPGHVAQPNENFDEINQSLRELPDFDTQVKTLLLRIQPNFSIYVEKYRLLCADLQNVLREIFRNCHIHPFGSTITGLAFKNSDVDIYVEVFEKEKRLVHASEYPKAQIYVNKSKGLLHKYKSIFSQIRAIPTAKTPIVRCLHIQTNINCDFNFKNMLGVCNSCLISYYISLDSKLKSLIMIVKYWAKVHNLSGSSGKFSNYALTMLIIFFLQQDPFNLPSVISLQTANYVNMQEGWNGGFERKGVDCAALKTHSLPEILHKFFQYYSSFDYSLHIACPFVGITVQKTDFLKIESIPDEFELYKKNVINQQLPLKVENPITVQDPFEHNHNLTGSVPLKVLEEFVKLCQLGANIFKDTPPDQLALYKLVNDEVESFSSKKSGNYDVECKFKIAMSSSLLHLDKIVTENSDHLPASDEKLILMKNAWYNLVNKFIVTVLCSVMKFNVNIQDDSESKSQKLDGQVDVHDSNIIEKICFNCTGVYNLWEARKSIAKDINLSESLSVLEKEIALTNYICNDLYKDIQLNDVIVKFNMEMQAKINPTEMYFHITKIEAKKGCFRPFVLHFSKYVPKLFEKYINELDGKNVKVKTTNDQNKEVA